jgi:hypothetical protein
MWKPSSPESKRREGYTSKIKKGTIYETFWFHKLRQPATSCSGAATAGLVVCFRPVNWGVNDLFCESIVFPHDPQVMISIRNAEI